MRPSKNLSQSPSRFFLPKIRILAGAIALAAGSMLHAKEVRLTELLQLAMSKHPTVLQARSQLQSAGFDLESAKWARFPSVSAEARSDSRSAQSIAKVEQPLWAGGRISARIELGEANLRAAQANLQDAELNALTQTGTAFFEVLRLTARLQAAVDNCQQHQRLVDLISRRSDAQVSAPADVTLAQARLQQALNEQLQIQRQLESARNSLSQWAGPLDGSPTEPRGLKYQRPSSEVTLLEQAVEFSAQRKRLLAQRDAARAQSDLARAQIHPTVVAGYQHIVSGPLASDQSRGRSYIGLQFQPGAGLSSLSDAQSALAKIDAIEQEIKTLQISLETQTRTLYSDIDVLQAQSLPAQQLLTGMGELVQSYLRQYEIGRKNWLDVLNTQREKAQALYNLADVKHNLMLAQLRLMLITGAITKADTSSIHE